MRPFEPERPFFRVQSRVVVHELHDVLRTQEFADVRVIMAVFRIFPELEVVSTSGGGHKIGNREWKMDQACGGHICEVGNTLRAVF